MKKQLPHQDMRWAPLCATGGALVLAAALFLLIPVTQLLDPPVEVDMTLRSAKLIPPLSEPPSPPPPDEVTPPKPDLSLPQMAHEPPPIELEPLDIAFSPGMGEAIAMGTASPDFQMERDAVAEIQHFFSFDDLAETPSLVATPQFRFPQELERRGIREGKVIVEIDILPDGRAELRRIVSSSHHELESVARSIIEKARFTQPIINGKPQTVRGNFPLVLRN